LEKIKYICSEIGCLFAAQIAILDNKPNEVKVETSGLFVLSCYVFTFLDEHNHNIQKNLYCTKMLRKAINEEPDKKTQAYLEIN